MNKKFIIITGGEFINKGAQEMTFITLCEVKKRFPQYEIVVLSDVDYERSPFDKRNYNFLIRAEYICTKRLCDPFDIWFQKHSILKRKSDDIIQILENAEIMIDISGYALSSQWKLELSLKYLHRIYVAKYYGIKVFILPQSFGPFDYEKKYIKIMNFLLTNLLKYPNIICARENSGYLFLKKYCKDNLIKSDDMIWSYHYKINLSNIYKKWIPKSNIDIVTKNNITIVPNLRIIQFGNKNLNYIKFYSDIIYYLLKQQYNIYLIAHSQEDTNLCNAIKGIFLNEINVINLNTELNFWEFEDIMEKMDFIIASRFHSIVHAYKKYVPAILIGWAEKYKELAKIVKQERYVIDAREEITSNQVIEAFEVLEKNAELEREKIKQAIIFNKKNKNIFDEIHL